MENMKLETALNMIQNYATKYLDSTVDELGNYKDITDQLKTHSLPASIFEHVPDEFLKVYGEENGTLKWKELATKFFRLALLSNERVEIVELMHDILAMWDEERKFMYIGKDGKDYTSYKDVETADEFYDLNENDKINHR